MMCSFFFRVLRGASSSGILNSLSVGSHSSSSHSVSVVSASSFIIGIISSSSSSVWYCQLTIGSTSPITRSFALGCWLQEIALSSGQSDPSSCLLNRLVLGLAKLEIVASDWRSGSAFVVVVGNTIGRFCRVRPIPYFILFRFVWLSIYSFFLYVSIGTGDSMCDNSGGGGGGGGGCCCCCSCCHGWRSCVVRPTTFRCRRKYFVFFF